MYRSVTNNLITCVQHGHHMTCGLTGDGMTTLVILLAIGLLALWTLYFIASKK